MTPAQLQTLKTFINQNPAWAALPLNQTSAQFIADALNLNASPSFTAWKSNVTLPETALAFNGAEFASVTSANHSRLQTIAQYYSGGYNASSADIRAMWNDIMSSKTLTLASLLALWKRFATVVEKLFATGTGSDASPATLSFEGLLSADTVAQARELP